MLVGRDGGFCLLPPKDGKRLRRYGSYRTHRGDVLRPHDTQSRDTTAVQASLEGISLMGVRSECTVAAGGRAGRVLRVGHSRMTVPWC